MRQPDSLEQLIGQLFLCGFDGYECPERLLSHIEQQSCGGIILFSRNISSPHQVQKLNQYIYQASKGIPPWISVDQEGGRVARLKKPFTELPPQAVVGMMNDEQAAFDIGSILGEEASAVGFNIVFAPVLDIHTNPENPVIGDRSISSSPDIVGKLGWKVAEGIMSQGVLACGKHFPGHGDTSQDSHYTLPTLPHDLQRLKDIEWKPFRYNINKGLPAIMSAHVLFHALDEHFPATLSPQLLGDVLRKEMNFQGLIFSDDTEMKALEDNFTLEEIILRGLDAGLDQFLICHHWERLEKAITIVKKALQNKRLTEKRLLESWNRIMEAKQLYAKEQSLPELDSFLTPENPRQKRAATFFDIWNKKN